MLAAALLFSTGGVTIKATSFDAWQVAGMRSGIAAVFLALVIPRALKSLEPRVLAVALAYASTLLLFTLATKNTTAANAIFIQDAAPFWILLLAPLLLGEFAGRREGLIALALGAGVILLFLGEVDAQETASSPLRGNLYALAASLSWALTIMGLRGLAARPAGKGNPAVAATILGNALLFAFCLAVMDAPRNPSLQDWSLVFYLGIFQVGLAYICMTRAADRLPAFEISLLLLFDAVLTPVWAYLLLNETLGALSILGIAWLLGVLILHALSTRGET